MSTQATITIPISIKAFELLTDIEKKLVHGELVTGEWEEARQLQPKRMFICSQVSDGLL